MVQTGLREDNARHNLKSREEQPWASQLQKRHQRS